MAKLTDKTCLSTTYITPPMILDPVRAYFGGVISLDPATEPSNPVGAERFYSWPMHDGLALPWRGNVFVNPPYGKVLQSWVRKIALEANRMVHIVALLPGQRFETVYFQEGILASHALTAVVFIRKRVPFLRPDGKPAKGNPYGSMLYVFNGNRDRCGTCFSKIGHVADLEMIRRYSGN